MQNPLRSEEAAFRFVLGTLAYFAPMVVAAAFTPWLGVVVFVAATAVVVTLALRGRRSAIAPTEPPAQAQVEDTPPDQTLRPGGR